MGLSFEWAKETSARIKYEATFDLKPNAKNITYNGWIGNQYVYNNSGKVTITNLIPGTRHGINGEI